jgi:integrase
MPTRKRICATEGCRKQRKYLGRVWVDGTERYLGYFCSKRERTAAQEAYKVGLRNPVPTDRTCDDVAGEFLADYEERHKASSLTTARQSLKPFRDEFGDRPLGSITRDEAKRWAKTQPGASQPVVVTLFNWAIDEEMIPTNPFRKLTRRGRGRADKAPPTVKQLERLLDACDALKDYGPQMRNLVVFAAYTCMRPGELFELRWTDIDLAANRITVSRRLYRGTIDVPKNGEPKTIALPPPARDVLMRQPTRTDELAFVSKTGKRLTAPTVSQYWAVVKARAGLDFDLYHATKHYGVHLLYKLGLSKRAIAASVRLVGGRGGLAVAGVRARGRCGPVGDRRAVRRITDARTDARDRCARSLSGSEPTGTATTRSSSSPPGTLRRSSRISASRTSSVPKTTPASTCDRRSRSSWAWPSGTGRRAATTSSCRWTAARGGGAPPSVLGPARALPRSDRRRAPRSGVRARADLARRGRPGAVAARAEASAARLPARPSAHRPAADEVDHGPPPPPRGSVAPQAGRRRPRSGRAGERAAAGELARQARGPGEHGLTVAAVVAWRRRRAPRATDASAQRSAVRPSFNVAPSQSTAGDTWYGSMWWAASDSW